MNGLRKLWVGICLLLGSLISLQAQNMLSSLVQTTIPASQTFTPLLYDEIWLQSFRLSGSHSGLEIPSRYYLLDSSGLTILFPDSISADEIFLLIQYRKIPPGSFVSAGYSALAATEDSTPQREYLLKPSRPPSTLSTGNGNVLNYSGNLVRGIGLGNRQSLGFESAFNLQMSGQLAPDLSILGSISDQSVPLQPDGSTKALRDLDQIFIQLQKDSTTLTLGDFEQRRPAGYFMNYQKRSLGVQLGFQEQIDSSTTWLGRAGFAMNRGQFNRYILPNKEGNQGPYPLPGAKGEQLIVLIANTEKIYLNGILLTRGYDQDYIIDYNLGTITFTNKRMITQDSRIIAEYEYTDLAYPRSLFTAENQVQINRWTLQTNFYREQDSRKSGFGQELNDADRIILENAGDRSFGNFGSGIDLKSDYQEDQIRYKLIDTTINTIEYKDILVRSVDPELARYTAKFTDMGPGNGHYIRINPESNGAVYQWVAPDALTNKPLGQFEPVISLIAPQSQQMVTMGGRYEGVKGQVIETELAWSAQDKNRLSEVDDEDNNGLALFTKVYQPLTINGKNKMAVTGQYEYRNTNFREINPYRIAEFARDWNVQKIQNQEEHLGGLQLDIIRTQKAAFSYQIQTLIRPLDYQGTRHVLKGDINKNGWELHTNSSYLQARDSLNFTQFTRPNIVLSKTIKNLNSLKIGFETDIENQSQFNRKSNLLENGSFENQTYRGFARVPFKKQNLLEFCLSKRLNKLPEDGRMVKSTKSIDFALGGNLNPNKASQLSWNATYRKLTLLNQNLEGIRNTNSILGRLQYNLNLWKEALISSTIYEMNSGQEAKTTFLFKRTLQPGTGQYSWNDINGDSIQQINEFFLAPFQDQADFIRFAVLSDQFVQTNNIHFNQQLLIEPGRIWKVNKGIKFWLSKFSSVNFLNIERKTHQQSFLRAWNPFEQNSVDTSLVSTQSAWQSQIFFNRNHPVFESSVGLNNNFNKYLLLSGAEQNRQKTWNISGKYHFAEAWTLTAQYTAGEKEAISASFDLNSYHFHFWQLEPGISWQIDNEFQARGGLKWRNMMADQAETDIPASVVQPIIELQWALKQKTRLRTQMSYAQTKYERLDLPVLALAMLEGLSPGKNWLWGFSLEQKLSSSIYLILSYDGRKTGTTDPVHVGKAQIRAQF